MDKGVLQWVVQVEKGQKTGGMLGVVSKGWGLPRSQIFPSEESKLAWLELGQSSYLDFAQAYQALNLLRQIHPPLERGSFHILCHLAFNPTFLLV